MLDCFSKSNNLEISVGCQEKTSCWGGVDFCLFFTVQFNVNSVREGGARKTSAWGKGASYETPVPHIFTNGTALA